ncbi:MAG: RidA family protein [Deltaproteobacteria bacterium]|nr:MAG: RidA family protein [Deltaproteobacteria bacterium]
MKKDAVKTTEAPAAIGPYSQAVTVEASRLHFLSGQIPLDPATGEVVPGDVEAQTRQVMENLRAVLEACGCTFSNVVKSTIFLADLGDFETVNRVYGSYFEADPPARATVEVSALPKGVRVEIECVAAS